MTMILGGGANVFSSPPLCRARGLCFFLPSLVLLALVALMVARWRCCCGGGKETWRWCPGGEERSFFFSVLRPPVSVLLFPTSVLAFSPLSLKQIFLFFFLFPSVRFLSSLHSKPSLLCSALFRFLLFFFPSGFLFFPFPLPLSSCFPFCHCPSLFLQNFVPHSSFSFPSIYKQEKREAPPALSHRGVGGSGATLPLQGKVAAHLQAWCLCFFHNSGRVWVVACVMV